MNVLKRCHPGGGPADGKEEEERYISSDGD